jgi:zinc protease
MKARDERKRLRAFLPLLLALAVFGACATHKEPTAPAMPPEQVAAPAVAAAPAATADGHAAADAAPLPVDPAYRTGTLDNGLRYYVRKNAKPEKRAEIWLAVNAGSVLEDDDQNGLAHFVEHMAFNGTEHFERQQLIDYMEKAGMRFGADLNAFTSFDETIYNLKVPTDDPKAVATAFQILEDWAHGLRFDDDEIDKERGVVVEEWRRGRGAQARMQDKQFPILFQGSKYAERNVIGKPEVLQTAPHDVLKRYWKDWYRPELMAVIAVGDFDPAAIEATIREQFARIPKTADARKREIFQVPDHEETLVSIASDPEATNSRVSIFYKLPRSERGTAADYRRALVQGLYDRMLNARLDEKRQLADPPFLFAFSGKGDFVRSRDVVFQVAAVKQGEVDRGLEALLLEVARVDKYGFTQTELDRAKQETLRAYEQGYKERDKEESERYANEAVSNFLVGEPMPGIEVELELVRRFLPGVTLEETNRLTRESITTRNRVILVNVPEKAGLAVPTETEIRGVFAAAEKKPVEAYVDQVRQAPLVEKAPAPGTVVEESKIAEIGVTQWKLSNGATVVLKPTDFKNDQILLSGFALGGHSLVQDADFVSAAYATAVIAEGGAGTFNRIELRKALTGKVASASAYIGELEEGIRGSASPQDVETMFQLLYLEFTSPRVDREAFDSWRARTKAQLENRLAQPETVFGDRYTSETTLGHPRRQPPSPEKLAMVDLDRAASIYRDRFADASGFTFVLVGNFTLDGIRPQVLTWIGGLPSSNRKETWRDVGVRYPEKVVSFEVKKGVEPKSQFRVTFQGPADWSRQNDHEMDSMTSALRIRLREVLREDMGGVYGVSVFGGISRQPRQTYSVAISFTCSPEHVESLKNAVFDVIAAFQKGDVPQAIVEKVKEQQIRSAETDLKENGFWLGELTASYRYRTDPKLIPVYDDLVKTVSAEGIAAASRRYADTSRYVLGVLNPENAPK